MDTHKASTRLAERGPFIRGLVEVVCVEVEAQLGTYRHSPHEVRGDFFTADFPLPASRTGGNPCNTSRSSRQQASALVRAFSPVSLVSAEGEGEVGCYFLKVLQCDVTVLALVVVLHDGLQGATEPSETQRVRERLV